jgi:hypothetical protein
MKHFYALVFPFLAFFGPASAQFLASNGVSSHPLPGESIPVNDAPEWQKQQDEVNGHIPGGKLARMKNVSEAIVSYFHDSCITEGEFSPVWHGEYFSDPRGSCKDMKFGVQCDFSDNKASLIVLANNMNSLLMEPLVVNNQEIAAIRPSSGPDKDHLYFEYEGTSDGANDGSQRSENLRYRVWLVATGGQLPFVPVSRAEYLKEARMELTAARNVIVANMKNNMPVRSAAIQDADKKAGLEQLATLYSGMDLQVRTKMFLTNYKTDEEYQNENIDRETAGLDSTIALMDRLRVRMTAAALAKPAIVSVTAAGFNGFEDGHGGKMLIRPNPAYVSGEGNANTPRFLLVRWQYDPSESMTGAIDKQIRERFDGERLKEAVKAL